MSLKVIQFVTILFQQKKDIFPKTVLFENFRVNLQEEMTNFTSKLINFTVKVVDFRTKIDSFKMEMADFAMKITGLNQNRSISQQN